MMKRTKMCGEVTKKNVGETVVLNGWVAKIRDFGGLTFLDIRDRSGVCQIVCNESDMKDSEFSKVLSLRNEFVIAVKGKLALRNPQNINKKISTGEVELLADEISIFSESDPIPFALDDPNINENVRLKYRYLDLRRPVLQHNLMIRSKVCKIIRDYLDANGFIEVETPMLGKSTPEGARDYLVPSRVNPNTFYALPQSPQLYKQLLMIAGYDRYYQIARCFRDEDLRANRQPEFTQIDLEMSFVDQNDVMDMAEGMIKEVFSKILGLKFDSKFLSITYKEAMDRFGSDAPDMRFGLELVDISDIAKNSSLGIFVSAIENGGSVRLINVPSSVATLSRRDIETLVDFVKIYKAKGLSFIQVGENGEVKSSLSKFFSEKQMSDILKRANAKSGDVLLVCADKNDVVFASLGALRVHIANKYGLINKDEYKFCWVTDFPMFEYSEDEKRYKAVHHPFTAPSDSFLDDLENKKAVATAKAYDIVINGQEAGGGSIRIHNKKVQERVFRILGLSEDDISNRFGFFADAFKYGAPPHGGLAFGLDRLIMLLEKVSSIREVIAFPKTQAAADLMSEAPSKVDKKQLDELYIALKNVENKKD